MVVISVTNGQWWLMKFGELFMCFPLSVFFLDRRYTGTTN